MEEQLKNFDVRTTAIEQILLTLATKEDLRLTTDALQHEIETGFQDTKDQFQEAKNHADRLNEVTREQIHLVRGEMTALNGEVRGDIRALSKQIAALRALRRKKRS